MQGAIHFKMWVDRIEKSLLTQGKVVISKYTNELHRGVVKNISMSPHSKLELMHLDHPFARRHGTIQPHGHTPLWSVHLKKGRVLKGLTKKGYLGKRHVRGMVGWLSPNKIVRWVIKKEGTQKMIGRPVLRLTAEQLNIYEKMRTDLEKMKPVKMKGGVA